MSLRIARWALAAAVAAMLAIVPSVARAGLWSAPATLGQDDAVVQGDVAIDAGGTAIVAWADHDGAVRAAVRPPGAAFSPTVTLAPDGAQAVAVGNDGHGGWLIAWSRNGSLGLAERTPGEPGLTVVPTGISGVQGAPDVAFAEKARAVVVWSGTDGAIHALSRELGGRSVPLADLDAGPGNSGPRLGAAGGHVVAAWTSRQDGPPQTTSGVRAALLAPAGSFTAPEVVTSVTHDQFYAAEPTAWKVVVSPGGAADMLIGQWEELLNYQEPSLAALVAARPLEEWLFPQRLGGAYFVPSGLRFDADIAAGQGGEALYVEGAPRMRSDSTVAFTVRGRTAGAASYGEASLLHTGAPGQVRVAPLAGSRFLVLLRSGSSLFSRAGNMATGFEDPLVFSGTDGSQLLGLAGAPSGLAAAAWLTTSGQIHAAIYDDSLRPGSPPPAAADTVRPVLSRLAVTPRRFARGTRIRWRLSEPARVTLRVDRLLRHGRVARQGSFARTARTGTTTVRFKGFVNRKKLRPGSYRLTAIARDAAGNRSAAKRTSFTVVRR